MQADSTLNPYLTPQKCYRTDGGGRRKEQADHGGEYVGTLVHFPNVKLCRCCGNQYRGFSESLKKRAGDIKVHVLMHEDLNLMPRTHIKQNKNWAQHSGSPSSHSSRGTDAGK